MRISATLCLFLFFFTLRGQDVVELLVKAHAMDSATMLATIPPTDSSGHLVFNLDAEALFVWDSTQWVLAAGNAGAGWLLEGNMGTNPIDNFLGTKDNVHLSIRTNDLERVTIGETQGAFYTNMSSVYDPIASSPSGVIGVQNILDGRNAYNGQDLWGIDNLLYTGQGSASVSGMLRGLRNRLWAENADALQKIVGAYNEVKIEGTSTTLNSFSGFVNDINVRAGADILDYRGFSNNFSGAFNGDITNLYGVYLQSPSELNSVANYYGFFQENLGVLASKYALFYDGDGTNTQDVVITGLGRIGVGTNVPDQPVVIDSKMANISGLRFEQLNSTSATQDALAIGVDATGNVVALESSKPNLVAEIFDMTGGQVINEGVLDTIFFAVSDIVDPIYMSTPTGIVITELGKYEVIYRISAAVVNNTRMGGEFYLHLNGAEVPGTRSYSYHRNRDLDKNTVTVARVIEVLSVPAKVGVLGQVYDSSGGGASQLRTVPNGSSLSVKRI